MSFKPYKRTLPTLTFPKVPPEKQIGDYMLSKITFNRTPYHSFLWERPRQDPVSHLTYARRVNHATEENYVERKIFKKQEEAKLKAQWQELYDKERELQQTFVKLSAFIQSNGEKRIRARKTYFLDSQLVVQRSQDIKKLEGKLKDLLNIRKELEDSIQTMHGYQDYLQRIVDVSTDFINPNEIIERYEALVNTRNMLGKRQDEALRELEMARAKISKMIEEYSFKILGLNNTVADLNSRYNTATRKALLWENVVFSIKNKSFTEFQELSAVKQSCWNTYHLMCGRKRETPKIEHQDVEKQLIYIKKTLRELQLVRQMAQKDQEVKHTSAISVQRAFHLKAP